MDRRGFVKTAAVLPAATIAALKKVPGPLLAQEAPIRTGGAFVKLSCNLYSFNDLLQSGEMTLDDVIEFCATLNFAAVDPTAYYFPGYPAVPDDSYLYAKPSFWDWISAEQGSGTISPFPGMTGGLPRSTLLRGGLNAQRVWVHRSYASSPGPAFPPDTRGTRSRHG